MLQYLKGGIALGTFLAFIWYIFIGFMLYGIIRLAVKHGISDSKKKIYDSVATLLGYFFYFHNFGGLLT